MIDDVGSTTVEFRSAIITTSEHIMEYASMSSLSQRLYLKKGQPLRRTVSSSGERLRPLLNPRELLSKRLMRLAWCALAEDVFCALSGNSKDAEYRHSR